MKKIIMLRGKDYSGKTTTLNLVYDELVNNRKAKVCSYVKLGWKGDDFACTLDYNNQKVAIFSMGDYVDDIRRAIDYYAHKSVDVLVIANRNKSQVDHFSTQTITKNKIRSALKQNADNMSCMMQIINAI
ncbi:MAG: hypothetical protein K2I13_00345 [Alistipes sp.]|nr:hypothetical protein [Alistipes sp.]